MSNIILNSLNDNINNNDILNKNLNNIYDGAMQKTYKNLEHLLHSSSSSSSSSTSTVSYSTNSIMIDSNSNLIDDQHQNIGDIWDHQITFEIPSNLDLERIKNLDNFTSLLHRIPSSSSSSSSSLSDLHHSNDDTFNDGGILDDTGAVSISGYDDINAINFANILNDHNIGDNNNNILDNNNIFGKWSITNSNDDNSVNSDYQMILNYLWIGIVISLIIMSIIFIVFSCYFYRKFREWKKCNKDIRAQLPNDLYPNGNMNNMTNASCLENGYYQMMESPPCYTIATGLPSYDEALMQATTTSTTASQNQQNQYHNHLSHNSNNSIEQQQQQQQQQNYIFDTRLMTSWEKPHHIETVECNNYVWDEGNNTFETTNLVVINNLTDVISNSNIYATNNNNVSKNSNNTKEIENVSYTHTTTNNSSNDINDDVINSAAATTVAVAGTTRTPATEFNYSDSDLVLSYEQNKNIEDIKENVKKQYEKNMRVEHENDINSSRIVSEQNNITGSLKDNNDRMEIVILS